MSADKSDERPTAGGSGAVLIADQDGKTTTETPLKPNEKPIRPNMLVVNAEGQSSTFAGLNISHSVFSQTAAFNSRFHASNFEGCAFDGCDFDGAVLSGCSFRAVELVNCDVDRLIINGINIGNLLKILMGDLGGGR